MRSLVPGKRQLFFHFDFLCAGFFHETVVEGDLSLFFALPPPDRGRAYLRHFRRSWFPFFLFPPGKKTLSQESDLSGPLLATFSPTVPLPAWPVLLEEMTFKTQKFTFLFGLAAGLHALPPLFSKSKLGPFSPLKCPANDPFLRVSNAASFPPPRSTPPQLVLGLGNGAYYPWSFRRHPVCLEVGLSFFPCASDAFPRLGWRRHAFASVI